MNSGIKTLKFIFVFLFIFACRPPQDATDFNITQGNLKDGDIIIDSEDDPNAPPRYYGEEAFTQSAGSSLSAVDIIWVVDNSGSMKEEQQNLKDNFSSFIQNFLVDGKAQYPFKMGVMTTEAYRISRDKDFFEGDGCFSSANACDMYNLTSQAAEDNFTKFSEDFKKAVGVGVSGSGDEKSLYSAHIMQEKYQSWFGGNDTLSIYILISDEQEQSHFIGNDKNNPLLDENNEQYTIEKWASYFQGLKDNPNKTRFFPIVRFKPVQGQDGDGDVGERYEKLAALTGGVRHDIDKPFDNILNGISTTIINLLDSFILASQRKIVESSIVVTVNGSINTDWQFKDNSIKFGTAPIDGSKILIRYEYSK